MSDAPPPIRSAATIMLLRDGPESLEVFMVERHHQVDFATGALVFPGGKVDARDHAPRLCERCDGIDGLDVAQAAFRIAAIRETFEECGVLLARPASSGELISADRLAGIEETHLAGLRSGATGLQEIVEREDLRLAADLLVPFARWITPNVMPKRFDTWFFLVAAPADHLALHDGGETVDSIWTTVDRAVQAEAAGERTIIFPTLTNLRKLGRSRCVAEAFAAARAAEIVTVEPWVAKDETGELALFIPENAGYDVVKTSVSSLRG